MPVQRPERELAHLVSIGPAMLRDFRMLGVHSVAQLAGEDPQQLYDHLCRITGKPEDPCVLDVFSAAVAQARDAELPPAQRQWWYWSRERTAAAGQWQDRKARDAKKNKRQKLTTPDLVLLSLLAERPMHGYEANAELERRQVRDWAGISRPQVYYSLEKLLRLGLVRGTASDEPQQGPERHVVATTARGRDALASALERPEWAEQSERPPFLTWMALSWLARPGVVKRQLQRRRNYLEQELERERTTLRAVLHEVGHKWHEAVWMITLVIAQLETELCWLEKLERDLGRRQKAMHPPRS